jgi:hypothetical protein
MKNQRNLRTYYVHVCRANGKVSMVWPATMWRSSARIRQFTIVVFRKYFGGLEPTFHWHLDGKMAEATDARGNRVFVDQENWWHQFRPGATTMRRPLCPMVVKGGVK